MMEKSIKKNAYAKTLLNIVNILIPLLAGPYLARTLDMDLYANYNAANSIIMWFIPFATLGIYNYGIRSISSVRTDKDKVNGLFSEYFVLGTISTIVVSLLYILFIFLFISEKNKGLYFILIIQLVSQAFYVEWMNEAFEEYGFIFWKTTIIKIIHLLLVFVLVKKNDDINIYAFIVSITMFANYFISFLKIKKNVNFKKVFIRKIQRHVQSLLIMLLLANANMLYTYLDRLFLSLFSTQIYEISYYQFSLSIIMLITQVINSITVVTIPRLSDYISNKMFKQSNKLFDKSISMFLMFGFPMCMGIAALSKEIIFLYGGYDYLAASLTLAVFSVRTICWIIDRVLSSQVLFVYEKEKTITKIYIKYGFLNLVFNILLSITNNVNSITMITSTMLCEILMIAEEYRAVSKISTFSYRILNKKNAVYLCSAISMFIYIYIIKDIVKIPFIINTQFFLYLILVSVSSGVIYFILIYIFKDPYFVEWISKNNLSVIYQKIKNNKK